MTSIAIQYEPSVYDIEVFVQHYTDCAECGWFGIPIIEWGAPDKCNRCLVAEITAYKNELQLGIIDGEKRREVLDAMKEAESDLDYFYDRQHQLPKTARRYNNGR